MTCVPPAARCGSTCLFDRTFNLMVGRMKMKRSAAAVAGKLKKNKRRKFLWNFLKEKKKRLGEKKKTNRQGRTGQRKSSRRPADEIKRVKRWLLFLLMQSGICCCFCRWRQAALVMAAIGHGRTSLGRKLAMRVGRRNILFSRP